MYQVTNAAGRLIELDDDEICPDGCSLRVPVQFMDSNTREMIDNLRQRHGLASLDDDDADDVADDEDDGDDEQQVADEQRQRASAAYLDMKARVARSMHRHRPGDFTVVDADGEELDRRELAYAAMKKRLSAPKKRKPIEHRGWRV